MFHCDNAQHLQLLYSLSCVHLTVPQTSARQVQFEVFLETFLTLMEHTVNNFLIILCNLFVCMSNGGQIFKMNNILPSLSIILLVLYSV